MTKDQVGSDESFVTDWKEVGVPGFDIQSLILNPEPVKDVKGLNSREVTFLGTYKNLDITCQCVIAFGDIDYHQEQYYYGHHMYRQMQSCRYITNYIGIFRAHVLDIVDFIQNPPKEPALFIIKPLYVNGKLSNYIRTKRWNGSYFEPLYLLQMFISMFYILEDAHRLNIGLVNISADSFNVNVDYTLDFDGFESCVSLEDNVVNRKRSWMTSTRLIKCPERSSLKNVYKKSVDIYLASTLMLELLRDYKSGARLSVVDHKTKTVTVNRNAVDKRHLMMVELIEQGLSYDPEQRPNASAILYALVGSRHQSLLAAKSKSLG